MISLFADRFIKRYLLLESKDKYVADENIEISLGGRYMLSSQNGGKSR